MYVIIKGSCHVRVRRTNIDGEVENPVVNTLYDGIHFGEISIL